MIVAKRVISPFSSFCRFFTSRYVRRGMLFVLLFPTVAVGLDKSDVQARIDRDLAAGRPIVVHVTVALCDNENQGIVPVPKALGNGRDTKKNLYWGALYGVRNHLTHSAGWKEIGRVKTPSPHILQRIILVKTFRRRGASVPFYLVADAWDGANIREALGHFMVMAAGSAQETIEVRHRGEKVEIRAGGASHLIAFVGHNGLMDFSLTHPPMRSKSAPARDAVVLACASKPYFLPLLKVAGAHPLLLTTGLMAPEAYTLDAAIAAWVEKGTTKSVLNAAAGAYNHYQRCGARAAKRLFWGAE